MNVFTFTSKHIAARIMAVMTLFALFTSLVPIPAFAADFYVDSFEAPNNISAQWTNVGWSSANDSDHTGSKSAKLVGANNAQTLTRTISTVGYNALTLSFWYKADDLEDADKVEFFYTTNGSTWTEFNQIDDDNDDNEWHKITFSIPAAGVNNANFGLRFDGSLSNGNDKVWIDDVLVSGTALPPPAVLGCTDPAATNYNAAATPDNANAANCTYPPVPVPGCTNPTATNFNPAATVDNGSCTFPPTPVPGCTDPAATNYNAAATQDNGSCILPVPGCTDPAAINYSPAANVDNGSCIAPIPGCMDSDATNYNSLANVDDDSCTFPVPGCMNPAATNYNANATVDNGSCNFPAVPGCMTSTAINYNPLATEDNGSCIAPIPGCMDDAASNYNASANVNDDSCVYPIPGCTNPAATNYNANATVDNGSCTLPVTGCTNPAATNYNAVATQDNGSCILPIPGCTDDNADNYNPAANVNDNSCTYNESNQNTIRIEMCKFDVSENNAPIVGWGMTLTDGDTTRELVTGAGGCVTTNVPENSGPWDAIEEDPEGWQQDYVSVGQGVTFQRDLPNIAAEMQPWACRITLNTEAEETGNNPITHRCDFFNAPIEVIEPSACEIGNNLLVNGSFEENHGLLDNNWGIFNPVLGWSISLSDGLEIWRNFLTMPPVGGGNQIAELDGNDATRITQTVNGLTVGATYELKFDFAARSADATDNSIDVAVDGTTILATSTANTNWTTYSKTFVTDGSSDISFTDMGVPQGTVENPGGTGTLLDNVVLCYKSRPVIVDEQTYKIFGYVWHDDNGNDVWDGREENNEEEQGESPLAGRVIKITNEEQVSTTTTTDSNGYYEFNVPAGIWTITENLPEGWEHTYNESYEVIVPQPLNQSTFLDTVREFFIPTAHAALIAVPVRTDYGEYNFGNDESSVPSAGGGGGGGSLMTPSSRTPMVRGDSTDNTDTPEPKVLGDQVSLVPVGAPDAGSGGTSPLSIQLPTLVAAFLGRRRFDV